MARDDSEKDAAADPALRPRYPQSVPAFAWAAVKMKYYSLMRLGSSLLHLEYFPVHLKPVSVGQGHMPP